QRGEHAVALAIEDDAALLHDDDAARVGNGGGPVRGDDQRVARREAIDEHLQGARLESLVERRGRLIEQPDARPPPPSAISRSRPRGWSRTSASSPSSRTTATSRSSGTVPARSRFSRSVPRKSCTSCGK